MVEYQEKPELTLLKRKIWKASDDMIPDLPFCRIVWKLKALNQTLNAGRSRENLSHTTKQSGFFSFFLLLSGANAILSTCES